MYSLRPADVFFFCSPLTVRELYGIEPAIGSKRAPFLYISDGDICGDCKELRAMQMHFDSYSDQVSFLNNSPIALNMGRTHTQKCIPDCDVRELVRADGHRDLLTFDAIRFPKTQTEVRSWRIVGASRSGACIHNSTLASSFLQLFGQPL